MAKKRGKDAFHAAFQRMEKKMSEHSQAMQLADLDAFQTFRWVLSQAQKDTLGK